MWYRPLSFPTKKGKEKTCTYDLCIKKIKCKKWFHWWFLSPFCKNVLFMFDSHSWDNVKSYFCHNKNLNRHFQSCLLIIYHYHFSWLIQQHRIFLKLHINLLQYAETLVSQMAMWEKLCQGCTWLQMYCFCCHFWRFEFIYTWLISRK